MNTEFIKALDELEQEKGISKAALLEAIQIALVSAYKKHSDSDDEEARVEIDDKTGEIRIYALKKVVGEDEFEDIGQITLEEARKINPDAELGDVCEIEVPVKNFSRVAAQAAKQVVVQRMREAERGIIYDRYAGRENTVMNATVHRMDRGNVYVELDRGVEGILPSSESVPTERHRINERLKVYVLEVKRTNKGPQIVVSRTHPGLVKRLFETEVPEISQSIVEIRSIAREAGARTKIAVASNEEKVDPVGSCVGPKGVRIERVVEELNGEKIDVIPWSTDPIEYIANALRPAKVVMVQINEDEKAAKVIVPDYQLSLAIGKEGQNARLAAKLTGWKIDIKSNSQSEQEAFGKSFANAGKKSAHGAPAVEDAYDLDDEFDLIDDLNDEEAAEEIEMDLILADNVDDDLDDLDEEDEEELDNVDMDLILSDDLD